MISWKVIKQYIIITVNMLIDISDSTQSIPISSNCPLYPLYTSHKRANALDLCGWNFFNHNELLDGFLKR